MSTDELTCEELVELITDYLEGALGPKERARFEEHVAVCEPCSIYLKQMKRTVAMAGALRGDSIPPAARDELLRAFRGWKAGGP
jgi:anti-sigma factor RsiW